MKKLSVIIPGILYASFAFGYITENVPNRCGSAYSRMEAKFQINEYTCASGYFLPANAIACVACPFGYTCSGGTYIFNTTESQGLMKTATPRIQNENNTCAANFPHNLFAVFELTEITCNPGQYLPADEMACVQCPANSYCTGGTYTLNSNVPQGVVSCASGLFAPTGMWELAQCGHTLHLGDDVIYLRSVKKTSPALNIDMDKDGVADYFANITTTETPMNANTTRKLKLYFNGQTYFVHDDTVNVGN